jgi:hypothetical protein
MGAKSLLKAIGVLAVVLYVLAIIYVGMINLRSPKPIVPPIIDYFVTSMSATLATFLGMVLGFKKANDKTGVPGAAVAPVTRLDWVQTIVAWTYVLSLVLGLVFWFLDGPFSDGAAQLLQNLTKSLVGLFVGAITVYLNVQEA